MDSNEKGEIFKTGFLKKRSKFLHLWKTRFFILTNNYLFGFTGIEKDADCTMTLLLGRCQSVESCDNILNKENTFSITTQERLYYFQATSEEERESWKTAISSQLKNKIEEVENEGGKVD